MSVECRTTYYECRTLRRAASILRRSWRLTAPLSETPTWFPNRRSLFRAWSSAAGDFYQVYATLFPIVCGVALASVAEVSFSWASFLPAVGSNTAFALRSTFSKKAMTTPRGEARATRETQ